MASLLSSGVMARDMVLPAFRPFSSIDPLLAWFQLYVFNSLI